MFDFGQLLKGCRARFVLVALLLFLLSPRASGITAQSVVVDAGMSINYFDNDLIRRALRPS